MHWGVRFLLARTGTALRTGALMQQHRSEHIWGMHASVLGVEATM